MRIGGAVVELWRQKRVAAGNLNIPVGYLETLQECLSHSVEWRTCCLSVSSERTACNPTGMFRFPAAAHF